MGLIENREQREIIVTAFRVVLVFRENKEEEGGGVNQAKSCLDARECVREVPIARIASEQQRERKEILVDRAEQSKAVRPVKSAYYFRCLLFLLFRRTYSFGVDGRTKYR